MSGRAPRKCLLDTFAIRRDEASALALVADDLRSTLEAVGLDLAKEHGPDRIQAILAGFFPHGVLWRRSDEQSRQRFATMERQQFTRVYEALNASPENTP